MILRNAIFPQININTARDGEHQQIQEWMTLLRTMEREFVCFLSEEPSKW